jgi:hypothetical protein
MKNLIDFQNNFVVECKMTCREYYDFRLLALSNKIEFLVEWQVNHCIVKCEAPFLIKCGFCAEIDF